MDERGRNIISKRTSPSLLVRVALESHIILRGLINLVFWWFNYCVAAKTKFNQTGFIERKLVVSRFVEETTPFDFSMIPAEAF